MPTPRGRAIASSDRFTYDDYLNLPEDGKRYEILDGDIAVSASPLLRHQRVSLTLTQILDAHVRTHRLGAVYVAPVDVVLDPSTVVMPDIVFVSTDRAHILKEQAILGAPDLIVEVLSPSTATRDRTTKAKLYSRFGVTHYWIVDADEGTVEVLELARSRYRKSSVYSGEDRFTSPLFPQLTIDIPALWEGA